MFQNFALITNYNIKFDFDKYWIHEKKTLKMTGLLKLVKGLYYLSIQFTPTTSVTSQITPQANSIIPKEALFHFSLRRIAYSRLLNLYNSFPFVNVDQGFNCDICYYARHRKQKNLLV